MKRNGMKVGWSVVGFSAAGLLAGAAQAQPSVLLAAAFGGAGCNEMDTQAKLLGTGLIGSVDIFDVSAGTPTLAQLMQYDAVMCWTNTTPADWTAWGDVMADYVDAGRRGRHGVRQQHDDGVAPPRRALGREPGLRGDRDPVRQRLGRRFARHRA